MEGMVHQGKCRLVPRRRWTTCRPSNTSKHLSPLKLQIVWSAPFFFLRPLMGWSPFSPHCRVIHTDWGASLRYTHVGRVWYLRNSTLSFWEGCVLCHYPLWPQLLAHRVCICRVSSLCLENERKTDWSETWVSQHAFLRWYFAGSPVLVCIKSMPSAWDSCRENVRSVKRIIKPLNCHNCHRWGPLRVWRSIALVQCIVPHGDGWRVFKVGFCF